MSDVRVRSAYVFPALLALGLSGCVPPSSGTTYGPGTEQSAVPAAASSPAGTAGAAQRISARTSKSQPVVEGHRIVFEILSKGTQKATSISYGIGGNMSQVNGTRLPWKKQATSADSFLILSLVAQSAGSSGSITCRIRVDGKVLVENSSQGQYAVVTCTGNA